MLLGFALVMIALDYLFSLAGMLLWMDIPMLVGGAGVIVYAWRAPAAA